MFQKLVPLAQAETRKLVWIIGLLFAVVVALQYFELPYGSLLSNLASTEEVPVQGKHSLRNGDSNIVQGKLNETKNSSFNEDDGGEKDSRSGISVKQGSISGAGNANDVDGGTSQEEDGEPELRFTGNGNGTTVVNSVPVGSLDGKTPSPQPVTLPTTSPSYVEEPVLEKNASDSAMTDNPSASLEMSNTEEENERPEDSQDDLSRSAKTSAMTPFPNIKKQSEKPVLDVYSLSDMNDLMTKSCDSYYSVIPQWSSAVDRELQDVALQIENAPTVHDDPNLHAPLYRNVSIFKRSYELMESILKVYIYKEGDRPILHTPFLRGLYASEGWFMKQLESNKRFVTKTPRKAHLFYLPFSSRMLEESLYVVDSHSHKNLIQYLENYVGLIAGKYPYWNRTGGADHFLVACHDWAPSETRKIMAKCIRALCNSDVKEGFVFGKDVSLPETYIHLPKNPVRDLGGKPPSKRSTLAFFAGSMHGYLRPILLRHWENKDPDMKIFGRLPKSKGNKNYANYMKSSKYCVCAKGYEVNSPRVVEAIFYECVPVIVSDNFVPPFFAVLNWESFAVFVAEKDIPELKKILLAIPEKRYRRMQMNVKRVQQHFLWHAKPEKYDIFHMILHSIWFNRLHRIRAELTD